MFLAAAAAAGASSPWRNKVMHRNHHSKTRFWATAALLISVISLSNFPVHAKSKEKKERKEQQQTKAVGIYLIGHLSLPETTVSGIAAASDPNRQLLQLTDTGRGTLTVVDVAQPSRPKLLEQSKLPAELAHANVQVRMGDAVLLTVSQTDSPSHADPQSLTLVSFADPANPKTVQTFESVTAVWRDRERELIYLSNADGLWVLQVYSAADKRAEEQFDEMIRSSHSGG
jgi:cell division protein FtsN